MNRGLAILAVVLVNMARTILGGFLMGSADMVPGVSGGTIALVIGIYERLVASIKEGSSALASLIRGRPGAFIRHLKAVEWHFLIPVLVGILVAVILLSSFIETQLEERPQVVAGVFAGLVSGSVLLAWRLLRRRSDRHYLIAAAVAVVFFVLLGVGDAGVVAEPSLLVFFLAGALAICAMILPGISGSLILVLVGMYEPVLGAVTDRRLLTIGVFVGGTVVGLAVFSQILHWALRHHHDDLIAGLVGLMAGSLRVLWPWPEGVSGSSLGAPGEGWPLVLVAALLGVAAVTLIARLDQSTPGTVIGSQPSG